MTFSRRFSPARLVFHVALVALLAVIAFPATPWIALPAAGAEDGRAVEPPDPLSGKLARYNPLTRELEEIAKEDLKPGCIYRHYSERLGADVWSFVDANMEFWYAFGPGTTQEARRFDLPLPREEAIKILERADPALAAALERTDRRAYLRLDGKGDWRVARDHVTHASIYNAETGERWEEVCRTVEVPDPEEANATEAVPGRAKTKFRRQCRYIPVTSLTGGNRWVVRGGRYVPAGAPRW